MKNIYKNLLFHLFVLALAVTINQPKALDPSSMICYVVTLAFPLGSFYSCYYWLVPNFLEKKRILTFVTLLFVLLNLITLTGYLALITISDILSGSTIHLFYRWGMHLSGITVMTAAAILGIVFRLINKWYKKKHK